MMNKERTKGIGRAKYLLLLPMVAMLLIGSNMNVQAGEIEIAQNMATVEKKTTNHEKDEIVKAAEKMPRFPGGEAAMMNFLSKNITYPQKAFEEKAQGNVVARFVVRKDGSIGDVELIRKVHPLLDDEAIRVIKSMPKFEPGTVGGKPVNVWYTIPISFAIPK